MGNYIEHSFIVEPKEQGSDVLIEQLSEIGFESFVENDEGFCAYIKEEDFDETKMNSIISRYKDIFKIDFSKKLIAKQNWNEEWEKSFEPIEIEGKCFVRAPFHEAKKGFMYDVIIEPKMSFGTGHHHTTQLMIGVLMSLNVKNKSLLDMGCGTGVLPIVAGMMGAQPIMAVDIDEWSYENTIENLERNGVKNVVVEKGDVNSLARKEFHTILANINKNVLLKDMSVYFNSLENGGNLVMSGFFETDVNEISEKAMELGLNFLEKRKSGEWTVLHFVK